ncbi:Lsr2 dimerization domain-containing protein, partial [Pseudonocardia zijingensis]
MTRLVDDIDGSDAVKTLSFALDGHSYEIDLSERHLDAFREAVAPFVTAARVVDGDRATALPAAPAAPVRAQATPRPARAVTPEPTPEPAPPAVVTRDVIPQEPAPARSAALDVAPFRAPTGGEAARPA